MEILNEPEAIIVLGRKLEGVKGAACISDIYQHRLDFAIDLYRGRMQRGIISKLIISGGDLGRLGKTEARAGFECIHGRMPELKEGIDVILEEQAFDTLGNAAYTKLILLEESITRATIVSSDYHIPRVGFIFNYVFFFGFGLAFAGSPSGLSLPDYKRHANSELVKLNEIMRLFSEERIGMGEHKKLSDYLKGNGGFHIEDLT